MGAGATIALLLAGEVGGALGFAGCDAVGKAGVEVKLLAWARAFSAKELKDDIEVLAVIQGLGIGSDRSCTDVKRSLIGRIGDFGVDILGEAELSGLALRVASNSFAPLRKFTGKGVIVKLAECKGIALCVAVD